MIARFVKRQIERQTGQRWAIEVAGVLLLALAASMWITPLGIAVVGAYLVVLSSADDDGNAGSGGPQP